MQEGVHKMSCGGCGNSKVEIYSSQEDFGAEFFVQCLECGAITVLHVDKPSIRINYSHPAANMGGADGTLCFLKK